LHRETLSEILAVYNNAVNAGSHHCPAKRRQADEVYKSEFADRQIVAKVKAHCAAVENNFMLDRFRTSP
jgi:hypothetical protein